MGWIWEGIWGRNSMTRTQWRALNNAHSITRTQWRALNDAHSMMRTQERALKNAHSMTLTQGHALKDLLWGIRNKNGIKGKDMRRDLGKESKEYSYRRITKLLKFKNKRNFMHLQKEKHIKRKVNSSLGRCALNDAHLMMRTQWCAHNGAHSMTPTQ